MLKRCLAIKMVVLVIASLGSSFAFAGDAFKVDRQHVADPTKPSGYRRALSSEAVQTPAHNFTLSSIVFGGSRSQAVINGRFYQQGDWVDGARIIDIQRDSVTLQNETGSRVLRWKPAASLKRK